MRLFRNLAVVGALACAFRCAGAAEKPAATTPNPRHIANGWNIPSEGYADQPYIVKTETGGVLCDGGEERQFGWGRFSPTLRAPNGAATLKIAKSVQSLRVYARALRTSEAVGNFRAGTP